MKHSTNISWEGDYMPDVEVLSLIAEESEDELLHRRLYSLLTGYYCLNTEDSVLTIFLNNIHFSTNVQTGSAEILLVVLSNIKDINDDLEDAGNICALFDASEELTLFLQACDSLHEFLTGLYTEVFNLITTATGIVPEELEKQILATNA